MAPDARKRLSRRGLALRDLVLVMRKDEVHAAAVEIDRLAEDRHRHRGAFEVPAGTAASPRRIPGGAALLVLGLRRFPEREILCVLLRVVVLRHARAGLQFARVEPRELAVGGELADREIDRPVVRLVRDALVHQALDERDHFGDIVRRPRIVLRALDAKIFPVPVEDLDHGLGELANLLLLLGRALDDLVVDVGEVHHLLDAPSPQAQHAPQQVLEEERAEVAEVRRVVDRGAARVEPHGAAVRRARTARSGA